MKNKIYWPWSFYTWPWSILTLALNTDDNLFLCEVRNLPGSKVTILEIRSWTLGLAIRYSQRMYLGVIDHAESNGNVIFGNPCFSGAARLLAQLLQELSHNLIFLGVIGHAESNGNVHFLIPCFSGAARLLAQLMQELSHNSSRKRAG